MERTMKFLIMLVILAAIAPMVSADFSYEMRNARPGANEPTISRTWMSDTALRSEPDPKTVQIINFTTRELIELNVPEKTYRVTKFDDLLSPASGKPGDQKAHSGNALTRMVESMEVTRSSETQVIKDYHCVLVKATIKGGSPIDYWVTKDLSNSSYGKIMEQVEKNREIFKNHQVLQNILNENDAFRKLDGFSMKTISKFMRMELVSEAANLSFEKIDPKMFLPPEDFKKVEKK